MTDSRWTAPTDETHDASRQSWVPSARAHPQFPLQNLPLGVFSPAGGEPRGGVALGDEILDLRALAQLRLIDGVAAQAVAAASGPSLNPLLALGRAPRATLLQLPGGETRAFLQDGDELILRARAERPGFATIGFGDCAGQVLPAPVL